MAIRVIVLNAHVGDEDLIVCLLEKVLDDYEISVCFKLSEEDEDGVLVAKVLCSGNENESFASKEVTDALSYFLPCAERRICSAAFVADDLDKDPRFWM